jgi:hypothetical protein
LIVWIQLLRDYQKHDQTGINQNYNKMNNIDNHETAGKNPGQITQKSISLMRKLRFSATVTAILGFISVFALILLYLALSDIANKEEDLTLEWYIAGVSLVILANFIVSTFVTLGFLIKISLLWKHNPTE